MSQELDLISWLRKCWNLVRRYTYRVHECWLVDGAHGLRTLSEGDLTSPATLSTFCVVRPHPWPGIGPNRRNRPKVEHSRHSLADIARKAHPWRRQ